MPNITLNSIVGRGSLTETNNNGRIVIYGKFTTSNSTELHLLHQEESQALYHGPVITNGVSKYMNITVHLGKFNNFLHEASIELHA